MELIKGRIREKVTGLYYNAYNSYWIVNEDECKIYYIYAESLLCVRCDSVERDLYEFIPDPQPEKFPLANQQIFTTDGKRVDVHVEPFYLVGRDRVGFLITTDKNGKIHRHCPEYAYKPMPEPIETIEHDGNLYNKEDYDNLVNLAVKGLTPIEK